MNCWHNFNFHGYISRFFAKKSLIDGSFRLAGGASFGPTGLIYVLENRVEPAFLTEGQELEMKSKMM